MNYEGGQSMDVDKVFRKIHRMLEDKEDRKISQREVAERIGCSLDTYSAHYRGTNKPTSVKHFLELLSLLNDEDILKAIKLYKYKTNKDTNELA